MSQPGGSGPRRSPSRQLALGGLLLVLVLAILLGLGVVVQGSPREAVPSTGTHVASAMPAASPSVASATPAASPGVASATASSPPASAEDPVLLGAGDIAMCDRDADAQTAALLASQAGTVFTAGDNAYPDGSPEQFTDCYGPTWGRELARTRPAPGNHDRRTTDLAGYLGYFGAAAAPNGTAWYSYDLGTWHVIVLDAACDATAGCAADSEQGRWLAADLAASHATCTVAIWHEPRFSSGEHGNDAAVAPFWDALYAAGADLVINGHDHDYERFAPQDPSGAADPSRGIREFVVGTGGADLRGFGTPVANSDVREASSHGIIRLVLHPASYEWTFRTTSGEIRDSGQADCH